MLLFIYTFFSFFLIWIVAERKLNIQFKYIVIFAFVLIEINKFDRPNRPVRRGRRGSLIGRLKVKKPKRPERRKRPNPRRRL